MFFIEVCAQQDPTSSVRELRKLAPSLEPFALNVSPSSLTMPLAAAIIFARSAHCFFRISKKKRERAPVVLVNHIIAGFLAAILKRLGFPMELVTVGLIAGKPPAGLGARIREWMYRFTFGSAYRIMCYSKHECDDYSKRFGLPLDRFHRIPCKVRLGNGWDAVPSIRDLPTEYVASAGRSNRDFSTLASAACDISIPTVIASDLNNVESSNKVEVRSDLYWGRYLTFLSRARVVVVPLARMNESSGQMVMLEAMLLGRPVVVTRTHTTQEYGKNRIHCLFVDAARPSEISAAVNEILGDAALARRLSVMGKRHARTRHDARAQARAILAGLVGDVQGARSLPRCTVDPVIPSVASPRSAAQPLES